jgi:predicted DNA-binding transcriptional regulator YafY
MRADRLVAALLVLQARGQVTAPALARELEVSVKTARRDLEALAISGVPLYSLPGRSGGWQLVGGARTDLSGLTESEARALFFLVGAPAEATAAAKPALRKLLQAVPAPFRETARASAETVVRDETPWGRQRSREPLPLEPLRQAVVEQRQVELVYTDGAGRHSERTVRPLGLIKKGQGWYLLADTAAGRRTFLVDRIQRVVLTDAPVERSPDFDLAAEWQRVAARVNTWRRGAAAQLRVGQEQLEPLRDQFGADVVETEALPDGRVAVTVAGASIGLLAEQLAGWGNRIEVLSPASLRRELVRIGRELLCHNDPTARP